MNVLWVVAGLCVAAALLVSPAPGWTMCRIDPPPLPDRTPRWLGVRKEREDPFATAAGYDLLAVCLRAGMPMAAAAAVVAPTAPTAMAATLRRASELLALGADAETAWDADVASGSASATLCATARRSARAGSSPVRALTELAGTERAAAADAASAAAERAGVAVSGPLGLCFLPAFVCLGIVPVVVGLAGKVLGGGLAGKVLGGGLL